MKIKEKLQNKKVLIWGYGREGKATEQFIQQYCDVESLDVFVGTPAELDADSYDVIIKSPGIRVDEYLEKFTSQTELFMEEFSSQIVGITGTKGKSTTTSMLYKVLSECLDKKVLLVGNIGIPCLNLYEEIDADTVIVFELSCHQLANLSVSPHVGVFLNLYEEHLDYYGTMDKYFLAKSHVTMNQKSEDYFFAGANVPAIETQAQTTIVTYDPACHYDMLLQGEHNQLNAQFVSRIATQVFGCDAEKVRAAIATFEGLHHRLEYVDTIQGVAYYDDSISTIPEATIAALGSVPNAKTVLVGGMDRHIHYDILVEFIKNHGEYTYILMYESGKRILEQVEGLPYIHYCEDLYGAVALAKQLTPAGASCILSPAAASYGYFTNFEERGDVFCQLVRE